MIPVTRPYLPDREKLDRYIDGIYERGWLTNNGPLFHELTSRLKEYLAVDNLLLVGNGTLALQVAYRALGISGRNGSVEAITSPFTFAATAASLKWESVEPVFADIDSRTWCLDPKRIESAVTGDTRAIVPVHVFGSPCDVMGIQRIAERHDLKVVYDAAHAFGVTYKGNSVLGYGDAATLSFHATKLFHCIEGGAIIFKDREVLERARSMINFGFDQSGAISEIGINAKMNEFQAAMGLCVLDEMAENLAGREAVWRRYEKNLSGYVELQQRPREASNNYSYFPILLGSESRVVECQRTLEKEGLTARRYFYPSLNTVYDTGNRSAPGKAEDVSQRVLCLPIYESLPLEVVDRVCRIVIQNTDTNVVR